MLTIRRVTTKDAAFYARMMGDPGVYPGLMQMPYTDEALWQTRLAEINAPGKADLLLLAERDGTPLGACGLHPAGPSPRRRHAGHLGISVLPEAQRQGVGRALMNALCDYADNWLALLRLELNVYTDNAAAIALYQACGFVVEGTFRAYAMRNGRYVDTLAMARLHPNPPQLPAA